LISARDPRYRQALEGRAGASLSRAERPELDTEFRSPEGAAAITLAEIWSDLLGIERIGADDDFLELGGDSLLAIRLLARLRDRLHVDLTVADLFERPTVQLLAIQIEAAAGGDESDLSGIEEVDELEALCWPAWRGCRMTKSMPRSNNGGKIGEQ